METATNNNQIKATFKKYAVMLIIVRLVCHFWKTLATDGLNLANSLFREARGWTASQTALPTTIGGYCSIPIVIIISAAVKKLKNYKWIITVSVVLMALAISCIGYSDSYVMFFIGFFVLKIASDVTMIIPLQMVLGNWYLSRRGWVLGVVTLACPLSSAILTPMMTRCVVWFGAAPTFLLVGALVLATAVLTLFIKQTPEEVGTLPDGIVRSEEELEDLRAARQTKSKVTPMSILKMKETWGIVLGLGFGGFVMSGVLSSFVVTCTEIGFTLNGALNMMSVASLLGIPVSYIWGLVDDKVGTPRCLRWCTAVNIVFCLLPFLALRLGSKALAVGCVLAMANMTGGRPNLQPSIILYVFGREDFPVATGTITPLCNLIGYSGIPLIALIRDLTGSYASGYLACAVFALLGTLCLLLVRKSYDPERIAMKGVVSDS